MSYSKQQINILIRQNETLQSKFQTTLDQNTKLSNKILDLSLNYTSLKQSTITVQQPDIDLLDMNHQRCLSSDPQVTSQQTTRHTGSYNQAWSKTRALTRDTVEVKHLEGNVIWSIVEDDIFEERREAELKLFRMQKSVMILRLV